MSDNSLFIYNRNYVLELFGKKNAYIIDKLSKRFKTTHTGLYIPLEFWFYNNNNKIPNDFLIGPFIIDKCRIIIKFLKWCKFRISLKRLFLINTLKKSLNCSGCAESLNFSFIIMKYLKPYYIYKIKYTLKPISLTKYNFTFRSFEDLLINK